jgi:hypothetical protein
MIEALPPSLPEEGAADRRPATPAAANAPPRQPVN